MVIDPIGGAGNLAYKLSTLESQLCVFHVLLDNDRQENAAKEKAEKDGLLKTKKLTQTICNGMTEAEFEDCIDSNIYKDCLNRKLSINIDFTEFRGSKKWSDRMRALCLSQGKNWNDNFQSDIKSLVARTIAKHLEKSLHSNKRSSVDALVRALEDLLKGIA